MNRSFILYSKPAPTPQTPTTPAPSSASAAPDGFDPQLAKTLAPQVETHLRQMLQKKTKYDYSRKLVSDFQRAAGIAVDGAYGGGTRGALIYYGASRAPGPFFKPTNTIKYEPPLQAVA